MGRSSSAAEPSTVFSCPQFRAGPIRRLIYVNAPREENSFLPNLSRRGWMKSTGVFALAGAANAARMPSESPGTPKIAAPIQVQALDDAAIRRVKQIGVDWVLGGGPPIPWTEDKLRPL